MRSPHLLIHPELGSIVAISGLGGHAFGSFKEKGGEYMWLRDRLPSEFKGKDGRPMARIMIYGYESRVAESMSTQNLDGLGESFYNSLLLLATQPNSKPIIFIAHSLGGLIVKQVRRRIFAF